MKKLICLVIALVLIAVSAVACKKEEPDEGTTAPVTEAERKAPALSEIDMTPLSSLDGVTESEAETDYVILTVRKYGTIVIRLYPDVAPETVANFKSLVSQKFYDGLIFHRVIKGFMIQGGDPLGTGRGGSGTNIKGEFALNGFENNLSHVRGVISMARSDDQNPNTTADLNSASSQFFICQQDYAYGDGSYAAFGYVVYGMDAVDSIASVRTNSSDKPATDVVIESIRFATVAG